MKIHEYQAKEILRRYGVADAARAGDRRSGAKPRAICEEMGGKCVVKAQIHAGGRGKGGGVKLAKSPDEATEARRPDPRHAARHPPDRPRGPEGAQGPDRRGGRHRAGALRRGHPRPRSRASRWSSPRASGGMDIEEVAAKNPEAIHREQVDPQPRPAAVPGARASRAGSASRATSRRGPRKLVSALVAGLPRHRRLARRDQPADDHRPAATSWRSTPR